MPHTPGPWELRELPLNDGRFFVDPFIANTTAGTESDLANARLIASAPELLEACKAAVRDNVDTPGETIRLIEAAIAKATLSPVSSEKDI